MNNKTAIIIGAGPAGLTAAYELLTRTNIKPIIIEESDAIGGISKTVNHNGNRIDIGGHRFFSKSDRVTDWWLSFIPLQAAPALDEIILSKQRFPQDKTVDVDPQQTDKVMLVRNRVSRIFFLRKFFDYPISLNLATLVNLGLTRSIKVALSYAKTIIFRIKPEQSLEDFFINRFGNELYSIFFKDYTEKVWGLPCKDIKPEWGAQRVKGLSIAKTLTDALSKRLHKFWGTSLDTKNIETSLIEQFWYPKYGPGQMWELVAERICELGGEIILNTKIQQINTDSNKILSVNTSNETGKTTYTGEYYLSSMPVKDLIAGMNPAAPDNVSSVACELPYRDFITVGILVDNLSIPNTSGTQTINNIIPDNWIYIQEHYVKVGRIQVFNNWSPYMVQDINKVWLGLEFFCSEGDKLWSMHDNKIISFAADELRQIGFIENQVIIDSCVIRVKKAYPAYFGSYDKFSIIKDHISRFSNLIPIGRNGMHRYNNMDHSMLTAMSAIDIISSGSSDFSSIWAINTEDEYHETN